VPRQRSPMVRRRLRNNFDDDGNNITTVILRVLTA
jgi:hypothetical protein